MRCFGDEGEGGFERGFGPGFSELGYLKALVFLEVMVFSKRFSMDIFECFPHAVRTERV